MSPDRLTPEHLAAIETACECEIADQRSPGIGAHTILSLVAAVRERDNTIARVHAVFAEMDAHAPVTSNGFFYALKLRAALYPAALDPQETP